MPKMIRWSDFPNPPEGYSDLKVFEYKRIFDADLLPPLVIYVGTVKKDGKELPVIVVIEEGNGEAYMYIYSSRKEAEEEGRRYIEAYQVN